MTTIIEQGSGGGLRWAGKRQRTGEERGEKNKIGGGGQEGDGARMGSRCRESDEGSRALNLSLSLSLTLTVILKSMMFQLGPEPLLSF